jgi:hypothetical protein
MLAEEVLGEGAGVRGSGREPVLARGESCPVYDEEEEVDDPRSGSFSTRPLDDETVRCTEGLEGTVAEV